MIRPTLHAARRLPLMELSPDEFESFTHAALSILGPSIGFRLEQKTGAGGDGGFDSWAKRIGDGEGVCVQCKRYEQLDLGHVGLELAKVAMTAARDGAKVAEHIIVVGGKVARKVNTAVREGSRAVLLEAALEKGRHDDLKKLRAEISDRGLDPDVLIRAYVVGVAVQVWSGADFDARLGTVWSQMDELIERTFVVQPVLREHPRPDFDEVAYLARLEEPPAWVDPPVRRVDVSVGIRRFSAAAPAVDAPSVAAAPRVTERDVTAIANDLPLGTCDLLIGPGGGGKSTALQAIACRVASRRAADDSAPIPVIVPLKDYRGSVEELVRSELGVRNGVWRSLPGPFMLLLDGLTEVPPAAAQAVASEIAKLARDGHLGYIMSLRDSGVDQPVVLPCLGRTWALAPWATSDVRARAGRTLARAEVDRFMEQVWQRQATPAGAALFARPFNVAIAIGAFARSAAVQGTGADLIEQLLAYRFERNRELDSARGVRSPARTLLDRLARDIAYELRVVQRRRSSSRPEIEAMVHASRVAPTNREVFGLDALTDPEALDTLVRYEILVRSSTDRFSFDHDIVSGYFAAARLAPRWREEIDGVGDPTVEDVWTFVARFVPAADHRALLAEVARRNGYLAVQMALEASLADLAEEMLLERVDDLTEPGLTAARWMLGAARLGTPRVLDRLRALRTRTAPDAEQWRDQAFRALALAGDPETLRQAQADADHFAVPPFDPIDGIVSAWEDAPPAPALALARAALNAAGGDQRIGASARTIRRHGDLSDVPRLEDFAMRSTVLYQILCAWRALRAIDRGRAGALMERVMLRVAPLGRVDCYAALATEGDEVDAPWLVSLVVQSASKLAGAYESTLDQAIVAQRTAARVLERLHLSAEHRATIVAHYPASDSKDLLWDIVSPDRWPEFDRIAFDEAQLAAETGVADQVAEASQFAAGRDWPADRRQAFDELLFRFVRRDKTSDIVVLARVLADLARAGHGAFVADVLAARLHAWLTEHAAALEDSTPDVDLDPFREAMAVVADLLPEDIRLALLPVPSILQATLDAHASLYRGVPVDRVDSKLTAITDPLSRASALAKLAPHGSSPARITALAASMVKYAARPAILLIVMQAARAMWSAETARAVVDAVSTMSWDDDEMAPHTKAILVHAGLPFTRGEAESLLAPAIAGTGTWQAREVLELWRALALRADLAGT